MSEPIAVGAPAPDFTLPVTADQTLGLSELRGRPVVLVFYPADWSPVCSDEMALYSEILDEFATHQVQLLGISVDGPWCHAAFAKDRRLRFPLLADFEPKGAVAQRYGVYRQQEGVCERALFLIDGRGIVRWRYVSPIAITPAPNLVLDAIECLRASDLAQASTPQAGAPRAGAPQVGAR